MHDTPAISVIIPTCDRPELLRVALKSLAWQTFRDFEAIVVNDGKEDIGPVIQDFLPNLDIKAVAHNFPYKGVSAARNTGFRLSKGKYLAYLDDDDFFYMEHLRILYTAVSSDAAKVVYSDAVFAQQEKIGDQYRTISRELPLSLNFDPKVLAAQNITPLLSLMHEKHCLQRCLPFAWYLRGHEDWDMWQRLGRHYNFMHLAVPTAEFIRRKGAESLSAVRGTMAESWLFVRRQGLLHNALPPVYDLEAKAAKGVRLGESCGPCLVSVILSRPHALSGLAAPSSSTAFAQLCSRLGDSQLILTGSGEGMPLLYQQAAKLLKRPPRCIQYPFDVGRVLSANQGAELAEGEWLVFLEPEVEPYDGWLDSLLEAAEKSPSAGALGGALMAPRGGCLAGGRFNNRNELIFNRLPKDSADAGILEVPCLPGLCLMVRKSHFTALNGFSLAFAPGHYADADLCLRLQQHGLSSIAVPRARLLWNKRDVPLSQSPAGLVSRRTFWDSWITEPFPLDRLTAGSEWSMRPRDDFSLWLSDGIMPSDFDVKMPQRLRNA